MVIRIFCTFREPPNYRRAQFGLHCFYKSERRDMPMAFATSVFPDDLQILPQLDPAAVWQEASEIYAGINHAIAADD